MRIVSSVCGAVDGFLRGFAGLCLFGMLALVVSQVILRYGGGSVPAYTEELARYAMIWMALAATAIAVREGSHIRIGLIPAALDAAAPRLAWALEAVLDTICLGLFLVLVWQGIDMVAFAHGQTSEGLRVRLSYPYAAVPAAFLLAAVFSAARLLSGKRT